MPAEVSVAIIAGNLNRIYKQSSHYQVKQRAHCILLSYEGKTISELMEIFQVTRGTIY
ncbi:MAG: helix-turn-helix domain-containing protein, partial [Nostoc sp.]